MTLTGTNHFVSFAHAVSYYRSQFGAGAREAVIAKLKTHEIEIGVPKLKDNERLRVIDGGKRYAVEDGRPTG